MAASAVGMMTSSTLAESNSSSSSCFLLDCPSPSSTYGWMSPRISFSRDDGNHIAPSPSLPNNIPRSIANKKKKQLQHGGDCEEEEEEEEEGNIVLDFEFRLNDGDPVIMLPADELFADGKLVPLQLKPTHPLPLPLPVPTGDNDVVALPPTRVEISNPTETGMVLVGDQYVFSPKMPVRCTSRWKELLGLKKSSSSSSTRPHHHRSPPPNNQTSSAATPTLTAPTSTPSASPNSNQTQLVRGLKQYFLSRNAKTGTTTSSSSGEATETSLGVSTTRSYIPLLRDSSSSSSSSADSSCRLSHSSSSSSSIFDHDDLPRVSLDCCFDKQPHRLHLPPSSTKPLRVPRRTSSPCPHQPTPLAAVRVRRTTTSTISPRSSVDSPRMNSYGRIVFQSLERSSSSPGSFYANSVTSGRRIRGGKQQHTRQPHLTRTLGSGNSSMERSYSANNVVHVTPVLNVKLPLRASSSSSAFGFLSPHKKDSSTAAGATRGVSKGGAANVANASTATAAAVGSGSKARDCVIVGK